MSLDAVLKPGGDFLQWAKGLHLPCCTLVACALVEARWGAPDVRSVDAYFQLCGRDWWDDMNVVDGDRPWSVLGATRRVSETCRMYFDTNVKRLAPPLPEGWSVVQRWRGLNGASTPDPSDDMFVPGASGHTYLAHRDGDVVRIVQSSASRGLRDTLGTWSGSAGLDGFSVGVAHIEL